MKVVFYKRGLGLFDRLVRLWTRGPYSHCELVFGDVMIGADQRLGVCMRYLNEPLPPQRWDSIDIPLSEHAEALALRWCQGALGSKYDWLGLFLAQAFPVGRQHADRWFCSELCVAALQSIGLLTGEVPHNHSPVSLAKLLRQPGVLCRS